MFTLITLTGLVLLAAVAVTHLKLHRAIVGPRPHQPPLDRYPSITVVKPVRGLDPGAEENFAAALDSDYPGRVETIFVFDDRSEPAIPIARRVLARQARAGHSRSGRIVIAGQPPSHRTGKLNAMIAGVRAATGELLAFGDSDTRPSPSALRRLVEKLLGTPGAGSAFAPVVVAAPAQTAGDAGTALMLNGLYGPGVALAERRDGKMPFIMGQFMVFKRETLAAIGGLENIRGELVDDMYIGMRVVAAGLTNVVSEETLPIIMTGATLPQFAATFRRWMIFSRSGLPGWSFKWPAWFRGGLFWAAMVLTGVSLILSQPLAALMPALVMAAFGWSVVRLHRDLGGAPVAWRHAWVPFAVVLGGPLAILSAILWPEVSWRGRTYHLSADSRLSEATPELGPIVAPEPHWITASMRRAASSQASRIVALVLSVSALAPHDARALDARGPGPEWTETRSGDLVIFYRDDRQLGAREIVAISEGDAPPEAFHEALSAPGVVPYVRESRVIRQVSATDAISYVRINAPLISDRDSVLLVQTQRGTDATGGVFRTAWTTVAGYAPLYRDVVRMELNKGSWTLEPIDGGRRTRMTYRVVANPAGSIPRWIAASSSVRTVPGLFDALKNRVARQARLPAGPVLAARR